MAKEAITRISDLGTVVSNSFSDWLTDHADFADEVQGYAGQHASPRKINDLLINYFHRDFFPSVAAELESIKTDSTLDQSQYFATLLKKYLDIDLTEAMLPNAANPCPSAFHAHPDPASLDNLLHQYFLAPYRLFKIEERSRKYPAKDQRAWQWHRNSQSRNPSEATDAARLFRALIQLMILTHIFETVEENEGEFDHNAIRDHFGALQAISVNLLLTCEEILKQIAVISTQAQAPDKMEQNPGGLLGLPRGMRHGDNREFRWLNQTFPGFVRLLELYPLGRLILGEQPHEVREMRANDQLAGVEPSAMYYIKWIAYWLIAHLNLDASLYWTRQYYGAIKKIIIQYREFIQADQAELDMLFRFAFHIPLLSIWLCFTPMLIMFQAVYGLTSLPFSVLRSLIYRIPIDSLRTYDALDGLNIAETIKDGMLIFYYIAPWTFGLIAAMNTVYPVWMLEAGGEIGGVFIGVLIISLNVTHVDFEYLMELARSNTVRFVSTTSIFGMAVYLSSAFAFRALGLIVPRPLRRVFDTLAAPVMDLTRQFDRVFMQLIRFLPEEQQTGFTFEATQQNIVMPTAAVSSIPESLQNEATELKVKLSHLNGLCHFGIEKKEQLQNCIHRLEVTKDKTQQDIEDAIILARDILLNNFDAAERALIKILVTKLQEGNCQNPDPMLTKERQALRQSEGTNGDYQPSLQFLTTLRKSGMRQPDGGWKISGIDPVNMEAMEEKCRRIEASFLPV